MTAASALSQGTAGIRHVKLGPRDVTVERRADGTLLLRSQQALGSYPDKLTERLEFWAAETPTGARSPMSRRSNSPAVSASRSSTAGSPPNGQS